MIKMANSKNTKRALLTSAFSLLICFAMLIGTTFAWFTDTVQTGNSVIKSGNLDIEVQYTLDGDEWNDLDEAEDLFQKGLWEPGHTEIVALKVVNNGSLALKYAVNLNVIRETIGKTENGEDIKLSDYLEVSTLAVDDLGPLMVYMFGAAFESDNGIDWSDPTALASNTIWENRLEQNGDVQYVFIKVDMPESVGNEANHDGQHIPSIDLGINVLATQYTYEPDSISNLYDADAEYSWARVDNLDDLREAINSPTVKNIVLANDIEIAYDDVEVMTSYEQTALFKVTEDTVIDLNGQTIQFTYDSNRDGYPVAGEPQCWHGFYVYNGATLTIIDSSNDNSGKVYSDDPVGTYAVVAVGNSTVNIYGGTFYSKDGAAIYKNNGYVNIYGGVFETADHKWQLLNEGNNYRSYGPFMIYGGSFKSFEPGVTNSPETKVADGYKVVQDGDWYTVVPVTETTVTADATFDMAGQTIALDDVAEPYVMTSDNSGAKITLKNATYTGDAQGIYFGNYISASSDYNFNTQADNVTVKDLNVSTNITNGNNKLSAGVWVYGTFELNNCNMSGTTTTRTECTPYDVAFVNHSEGTVNGGEYGSMFVYTHSKVALKGVKVGKIACMTNTVVNKPLTIDKDCVIDTIEFVGSDSYTLNIVIEDGATVGSILYKGTEYTVADWNNYIASLGN